MLREIAKAVPSMAHKYTWTGGSEKLNQGLITILIDTIIVGAEYWGKTKTVCVAIRDTLTDVCQLFTKLDVSNMFYTCRPPPEAVGGIGVHIGDMVYGFPGLSFRWTHRSAPAQKLLGTYLRVLHPDQVIVLQYLDDMLMFRTYRSLLRMDTVELSTTLEPGGWVVNPKMRTRTSRAHPMDGEKHQPDGPHHEQRHGVPGSACDIVNQHVHNGVHPAGTAPHPRPHLVGVATW